METPQSTSLLSGWAFRIFLLVAALVGFIGVAQTLEHRLQVSSFGFGINASIAQVGKTQTLPTSWSSYEGRDRALFFVKIKPDAEPTNQAKRRGEFSTDLFLTKDTIAALLNGETRRITFAEGNPRRHLLQGDELPALPLGWLVLGLTSLGVFLYSLKLR